MPNKPTRSPKPILQFGVMLAAAALLAGCTATGGEQTGPGVQVTQQPQVAATPTMAPGSTTDPAPATAAATGMVGDSLPVTFSDGKAWFTALTAPQAPAPATDAATLIAQSGNTSQPWSTAYVTHVAITVTAVGKGQTAVSPTALNPLTLVARGGAGTLTSSTLFLTPAGCQPLPAQLTPVVGQTITVCITTLAIANSSPAATPPPTPAAQPAVDMNVAYQLAGAQTPLVVWAVNSSIPTPTYK